MLFTNRADLDAAVQGILTIEGNHVQVPDVQRLRHRLIDRLVYNAVFHENEDLRAFCRWLVREVAAARGVVPASIFGLYAAIGKGRVARAFTVPAVNIRLFTYDVARAYFRAAASASCGAFIFEIAKSEMGYTFQDPSEYATCILAAAVKEGHHGPVFIQGDHFQVNKKAYVQDAAKELDGLRDLIDQAIEAGFFNIDIDSSTLVDLVQVGEDAQQRPNYKVCAELTDYIRRREPQGVTVNVGGEIGEVGGINSNVAEFRAFIEGFTTELRTRNGDALGISKMSVQTGTEHGGVPTPTGGVADVKLDFNVLKDIGEVARREYQLAGTVQHGASTLPQELFDKFPQHACCEIHLATGFQNLVYDHPAFPRDLKEEMYRWLDANTRLERKEGQTDEQFYYKARKRALGPFKKQMWDLGDDVKDAIMRDVEAKLGFYIGKLGAGNTADLARDTVVSKRVDMPAPVSGLHKTAKKTFEYILSDTGGE